MDTKTSGNNSSQWVKNEPVVIIEVREAKPPRKCNKCHGVGKIGNRGRQILCPKCGGSGKA
jgi:DnaJ-class molecular chaperone